MFYNCIPIGEPPCFFVGRPFREFFFCAAFAKSMVNLGEPLPSILTLGEGTRSQEGEGTRSQEGGGWSSPSLMGACAIGEKVAAGGVSRAVAVAVASGSRHAPRAAAAAPVASVSSLRRRRASRRRGRRRTGWRRKEEDGKKEDDGKCDSSGMVLIS
jgi:hypothetical protein